MRVQWVTRPRQNADGNFLGYSTAVARMRLELSKIADLKDDAPVALTFGAPRIFRPVEGKTNVFFTMCESRTMYHDPVEREDALAKLRAADVIVTPSRFCAEIFAEITPRPVKVCHLGVDTQFFRPVTRLPPIAGRPFRWLYCGALNGRKFSMLPAIANRLFARARGALELYVKTTGVDVRDTLKTLEESGDAVEVEPGLWRGQGGWFDNRKLPVAELRELYAEAHAGFCLHHGEGWGLVPLEMMRTGLPIVISDYSGTREYADTSNAFLVPVGPGTDTEVWPDELAALQALDRVMSDYRTALKVGRKAARDAAGFTWGAAARRLRAILSGL